MLRDLPEGGEQLRLAPHLLQAERLQVLDPRPALMDPQDIDLLGQLGIGHQHLHHEAVELRLGQRIGPFLLDGVLRGEDREYARQRIRGPIDGHLPFLHGLQQGRLGLGRGSVDFIGQEELGEDRARAKLEGLLLRIEDAYAHNVGRHEVGRELDALELAFEDPCQDADQHGLGGPRNPLDEDVAPRRT